MEAALTNAESFAVTSKWYVRLMPCLTDLAFLLPASLLFLKMSGTKTLFADGDTGWHIRTGEWILEHGAVPTSDLFSYTKAHQPWFAWEWGWDLLFALIHRSWGLSGVGFVTVILLGLISVLLYRLVLNACQNDILSFFVTALALCGSSIHWLARPHLFSWLFFLGFLHLIGPLQRGSKAAFAALPALMVLWVNMHGAFFIGVALLLATAAGNAIEALVLEGKTVRQAYQHCRYLLWNAGTCLSATFVNPYTWKLHKHVVEFLGDAKLLDNIQEYQSISFHCAPALFFELMLLLAAAAAFWQLQAKKITPSLLTLMWIHLALLSARNIPLFMILTAPLCARWLQAMLELLQPLHRIGMIATTINEICEELKPIERAPRMHLASGCALLLMGVLFAGGAKGFEGQFNPDSFPEQAMEVVANSRAVHIFTYDQWGDYLIYRFSAGRPIFMDGRSDFFGTPIVEATQHIIGAQFDWKTQLKRFGVDMVLVKPDAPIATVLKICSDWRLRFDDGKVLVFESAWLQGDLTSSTVQRSQAIPDVEKRNQSRLSVERRNGK